MTSPWIEAEAPSPNPGGVSGSTPRLDVLRSKHGATIAASGPGDIAPGGAYLLDKLSVDANKYEFGKALPDGNFEIVKNGTPWAGIGFTSKPYAGVTVRMNHGQPVIIDKSGQVVYGTPIDPNDKTAHLT